MDEEESLYVEPNEVYYVNGPHHAVNQRQNFQHKRVHCSNVNESRNNGKQKGIVSR